MNIPIIILNWNGLDDTVECLDSLFKMNNQDFTVYLIDNNSSLNQQEILTKKYSSHPKVKLVFNDTNLGFTHAHINVWESTLRNQDNPFIITLNNDTIVDSNWLDAMIIAFKKTQCDVISSKMINYYDRTKMDNAGHRMLSTGEIIPIGHGLSISDYDEPFENIGACAGAALYSSKLLNNIGFFDPYFSTGYEDAEIGLRAITQGYKCYYEPKALVYHKMGQSIKKVFNLDYSIMIHTCILYSYFVNMPILNILIALPSFLFKYLAMLIIDIIFLRIEYLKVMYKSLRNTIKNRKLILRKRKEYKTKRINYFSHKFFISFLWFDIKRFWVHIVLRKKSAIDNY